MKVTHIILTATLLFISSFSFAASVCIVSVVNFESGRRFVTTKCNGELVFELEVKPPNNLDVIIGLATNDRMGEGYRLVGMTEIEKLPVWTFHKE